MDWVTRQKIEQLCKENNCFVAYSKGGYGPPATVLYNNHFGEFKSEYELQIYPSDLTKPWEDLEAMITEFATACSIRDCFNDG